MIYLLIKQITCIQEKQVKNLIEQTIPALKGKVEIYEIVGTTEADVFNGKISNESPIGKALLGQKAGDTVIADTPDGAVEIVIEKVL